MALLLIEAMRQLGFGARIVSGYLAARDGGAGSPIGSTGAGSTHAWGEIYLPGAGWIPFDPANGTMGAFGLIPVAVGRDISQVAPVSGGYVGATEAFLDMTVEVAVGGLA